VVRLAVTVVDDVVVIAVFPTPPHPVATYVHAVKWRVVGVDTQVTVMVSVPPAVTGNVNRTFPAWLAVPASRCLVTVPIVAVPAVFASDDAVTELSSI
jgi:hypothetical protein